MRTFIFLLCFLQLNATAYSAEEKPLVWIYTDLTDPSLPGKNKEGTINDPDDVSAMAGYLLMANEFKTLSIVVASTHRQEHATTPDQGVWARETFGHAYRVGLPGLQKDIGGYPETIHFHQSCIKESAERFQPDEKYASLENYDTVQLLLDQLEKTEEKINVLCWGSLTEPAILVQHLLTHDQKELLGKFRIIAHWTNSPFHQGTPEHPEKVANCSEDAKACAFLKESALEGLIEYRECGAIGQHGIVSGAPRGTDFFDQFKTSKLGTLFAEGKFVFQKVDHSDSATYWTLLPGWGVDLEDILPNGSNPPEVEKRNEQAFKDHSHRIHAELLRRSRAASLTAN
ncbi:MAG: nucleoside hydrolase-like domain-containing protein [Verrucomicrobiota bacterium]